MSDQNVKIAKNGKIGKNRTIFFFFPFPVFGSPSGRTQLICPIRTSKSRKTGKSGKIGPFFFFFFRFLFSTSVSCFRFPFRPNSTHMSDQNVKIGKNGTIFFFSVSCFLLPFPVSGSPSGRTQLICPIRTSKSRKTGKSGKIGPFFFLFPFPVSYPM